MADTIVKISVLANLPYANLMENRDIIRDKFRMLRIILLEERAKILVYEMPQWLQDTKEILWEI